MPNDNETRKKATGFFSTAFYYAFRGMFLPVSRFLARMHVTPNMVTCFSLFLGIVTGYFLAVNRLALALTCGATTGFLDIVDGQMAKEFGGKTPFGGILDSSIDRYIDFFFYAGLSMRYYFLDRPLWILVCASAFLGTVMISYVKARAESDGFDCRVGRLQRPERLALLGVGTLVSCFGYTIALDSVILFLAVGTHATAFTRLRHVYRQTLVNPDRPRT
ncbi:CDP-alcohol phosphatidyltransferase family protein [bacterium]|nr:CDP-alcohol phosphatidyltransferase family protein [bacterium]